MMENIKTEVQSVPKEPRIKKVARNVKIHKTVDDRLVALCEHLGMNPNAYLVSVIGKAVAQDEVSFLSANSLNTQVDILGEFMHALASKDSEK